MEDIFSSPRGAATDSTASTVGTPSPRRRKKKTTTTTTPPASRSVRFSIGSSSIGSPSSSRGGPRDSLDSCSSSVTASPPHASALAPRPRRKRRKIASSASSSASASSMAVHSGGNVISSSLSSCDANRNEGVGLDRNVRDEDGTNSVCSIGNNSLGSAASSSSSRKYYSGRIRIRKKCDVSSVPGLLTGDEKVKGAGTDVLAVQDAGSFRLWSEHCSYLCSSLSFGGGGNNVNNVSAMADASCELAHMVSLRRQRVELLGHEERGCAVTLLEALAQAPEMDGFSSDGKGDFVFRKRVARGLAVMIYFISMEMKQYPALRKHALEQKGALKGLACLVHFDDLVTLRRHMGSNDEHDTPSSQSSHATGTPSPPRQRHSGANDGSRDSSDADGPKTAAPGDPTKHGRKNRKKKRTNTRTARSEFSFDASSLNTINERVPSAFGVPSPVPFSNGHKMEFTNIADTTSLHAGATRGSLTPAATPDVDKPHSQTTTDGSAATAPPDDESLVKLNDALTRVKLPRPSHSNPDCPHCHPPTLSTGTIALHALRRILTPNVNEDDCNHQHHNDSSEETPATAAGVSPFQGNVALNSSGSLPVLASAMTKTIKALLLRRGCDGCLSQLGTRLHLLVQIVDDACCLSGDNRKEICRTDLGLIESLLRVIDRAANDDNDNDNNDAGSGGEKECWEDVVSSVLQTLTSITHENELAGSQLLKKRDEAAAKDNGNSGGTATKTGIEILFQFLYLCATRTKMTSRWYDSTIFCLNTLTNTVETNANFAATRILARLNVTVKNTKNTRIKLDGIKWLTKWLVSQTESYREAILNGSFGDETHKKGRHRHHVDDENKDDAAAEERDLSKTERESLVMAGNGFVLLSCLMKRHDDDARATQHVETTTTTTTTTVSKTSNHNVQHITDHLRQRILSKMPPTTDENGDSAGTVGVVYMIKTLKAFLNFYHYSVGALSFAVVTPVVKLIDELEKMM